MSKTSWPKVLYWLRSQLFKRIGFVGLNIWQLEQSTLGVRAHRLQEKIGLRFPIVLVGRSLCYEQVKHIPVESWLEARQIARHLPISSPFDGARKIKLTPDTGGGYRALITIINDSELDACLSSVPWALIPISWLASVLADGKAAQIELAQESMGFCPSQSKASTMLFNTDESRRDYWWALGVDPVNVAVVTHEDSLQRLLPAMSNMGVAQWVEAFSGNGSLSTFRLKELEWKRAGSLLAVVAVTYMIAISLLLSGFESITAARADEESSDFLNMLSVRKEMNFLIEQENQWKRLKDEQYPVWSIWPVIKEVREEGALVRAVLFDKGSVEATLLAQDATDVLERIVSNAHATNVESVSSTRIDRSTGLNEFTVSWDVRDDIQSEDLANNDD